MEQNEPPSYRDLHPTHDDDVKRAKAAVDRHRANIESDAENLPPKRHRWADIPSKSDRGKHRPAS